MSFDDRASRSNTIKFAHGTTTILVDHWTDEFTPAEDNLDRLMGVVISAAYDRITTLNKAAEKSPGRITRHTGTRSMSVNDTSARVKVTVNLDSPVPSFVLAGYVSEVLSKAEACMLHMVDPAAVEETSNSLVNLLRSSTALLFGGMPPEAMTDMFGPAFSQASHADSDPYHSADTSAYMGQGL